MLVEKNNTHIANDAKRLQVACIRVVSKGNQNVAEIMEIAI
jgi:hypothetical protein